MTNEQRQKLETLYTRIKSDAYDSLLAEVTQELTGLEAELREAQLDWAKFTLRRSVFGPDDLDDDEKYEFEQLPSQIGELTEALIGAKERVKKLLAYS